MLLPTGQLAIDSFEKYLQFGWKRRLLHKCILPLCKQTLIIIAILLIKCNFLNIKRTCYFNRSFYRHCNKILNFIFNCFVVIVHTFPIELLLYSIHCVYTVHCIVETIHFSVGLIEVVHHSTKNEEDRKRTLWESQF